MYMEFFRLLIRQEHAGMVIKLDRHHGILYTIIEWIVRAISAYPAKVGLVEMRQGVVEVYLPRGMWEV